MLTKDRRYRNSLVVLEKAVNDWKARTPSILFIAQLGDLLDGLCKTRLNRFVICSSFR